MEWISATLHRFHACHVVRLTYSAQNGHHPAKRQVRRTCVTEVGVVYVWAGSTKLAAFGSNRCGFNEVRGELCESGAGVGAVSTCNSRD